MASDIAQQTPYTREERQSFTQRRLALPVILFLALLAAYLGLVTLTLAVPTLISVPLSVVTGVVIGMLFIVGHDASHNSFTRSTRLNQALGRVAFLPSLHALSLWDLSHNRTHHRYNSIRGIDYVWEPMTPADYQRSTPLRRALYRFYRTPAGVGFYYLFHLWAPRLFVPLPFVIGRARPIYYLDAALVLAFLGLQLWAVTGIGGSFGKDPWESVLPGLVIPFLVWYGFMSFVIFLHHTHPAVRWYKDEAAWAAENGALTGAVHVRFPVPFHQIVLSIMEHNAHHLASGVPLYNLPRMQQMLEGRGPLVTWRFSWRGYARVCRRCKLYDYDTGRWLSFDGRSA